MASEPPPVKAGAKGVMRRNGVPPGWESIGQRFLVFRAFLDRATRNVSPIFRSLQILTTIFLDNIAMKCLNLIYLTRNL